jgi:glyceraldehyde 3-phosphate dehydrogenase
LDAISYRVPTPVVTSADLTLTLKQDVDFSELSTSLHKLASDNPYLSLNEESLVSVDYKGNPSSAIIDLQWLKIIKNRTVKIVLWYDNEWGYCNRVVDLIKIISNSY